MKRIPYQPGASHERPLGARTLSGIHRRFEAELTDRRALPGPGRASLLPRTLTRAQRRALERATRSLHGALETVLDAVVADPDRARAWGFSPELVELCQIDPGYEHAVQIARFDGMLTEDGLRILEFNCDSPGGAARADDLDRAYARAAGRHPRLPAPTEPPRRLERLEAALLDCYRSWRAQAQRRAPAEPRIVVTDWRDVGTRSDIDRTIEHLSRRGHDVVFADPRELTLDGDVLCHEEQPVDLVYKRVILRELVAEPDARPLTTAYRNGTVCMVNPPSSAIAGDKRAMTTLFEPRIQDRMTREQRAAVRAHVPFTRLLEDVPVRAGNDSVPMRELAIEQQDAFVLKPAEGYGGQGVHLGFETDGEAWARLVEGQIGTGDWILQRLVPVPTGRYTRGSGPDLETLEMYETVNPFVFGGRFAGAYTRVSQQPRINVSSGGAIAPTVVTDA